VRDEYKPPPWDELQGRILAFGSDEVVGLFRNAHDADDRALQAHGRRGHEAAALAAEPSAHVSIEEVTAISARIGKLADKAEQADSELIFRVREELLGKQAGAGHRATFPRSPGTLPPMTFQASDAHGSAVIHQPGGSP
jgi:hypothetical protein